jgi:branched-chain amino acid transport system substrate-binding protein
MKLSRLAVSSAVTATLLAAGCSRPAVTAAADTGPVKVGLVVTTSGPLAAYGQQWLAGFHTGLDYATTKTGKVNGRQIQVTEADDAADPAKAVSAVKDLIGKGAHIVGGSVASGVAIQVAPIAAQNKVLFLSGPAATDAITGINRYTFRSGRQTMQDLATTQALVGDTSGKKILVFTQDNAFGQANLAAVKANPRGATITSVLVPVTATDFTPFAARAKAAAPDLLSVAWAGSTAPAMWLALKQQGALQNTTVVTGLDLRASYPTLADVADQLTLAAHYFAQATSNPVNQAMIAAVQASGAQTDLFTADGFVAALMLVHAVQASPDSVDKQVAALEGWSFDAPKGRGQRFRPDRGPRAERRRDRPAPGGHEMTGGTMSPDELDIPVAGGTLRVCRWPGQAGPTVLAAHGITANALSWAPVADALDRRATLIAADLRGRAHSARLPGPYGLALHADDLVAVLDHLGIDRAPVVGHSMGAFVAAAAAARYPDRVSSLLLVDGGVALQVPAGADIDAILEAVIGPAMRRLGMTFDTRRAYLDYWRAHPALSADWSPAIGAYALRDLVGEPPALRSSCVLEAVRQDATDTLLDEQTTTAVHRIGCPVTLLWCERGILNEPHGLYDDGRLDAAGVDRSRVTVERVADVNHYTVLLSAKGAGTVADHIGRLR